MTSKSKASFVSTDLEIAFLPLVRHRSSHRLAARVFLARAVREAVQSDGRHRAPGNAAERKSLRS
jgi:hypothetical protein